MGTNCALLLADLFLHAYEADYFQGVLKNKDRKLAQTFNSNFCHIDDALSFAILDWVSICIISIQTIDSFLTLTITL